MLGNSNHGSGILHAAGISGWQVQVAVAGHVKYLHFVVIRW